jgi:hypothetical protein
MTHRKNFAREWPRAFVAVDYNRPAFATQPRKPTIESTAGSHWPSTAVNAAKCVIVTIAVSALIPFFVIPAMAGFVISAVLVRMVVLRSAIIRVTPDSQIVISLPHSVAVTDVVCVAVNGFPGFVAPVTTVVAPRIPSILGECH